MSKTQNASTALVQIPSGFGEVTVTVPEGSRIPYIQFVYSKSKNYGQLLVKLPSLREGEPVLIQPAPANPIKLTPFKFFLLNASEFWGQYNQSGELLAVSSTKPSATNAKWDQTIEAAVLVILEDRLVPAQVRFKTTTCPAVYPAILASAEVKTDEWAKKGAEYAFTMRASEPWARFTTHATRIERTNREKGTTYPCMEAAVHPTTAAQFTLIGEFFGDKANIAMLKDVAAAYRKRLETAKAKEKQLVAA